MQDKSGRARRGSVAIAVLVALALGSIGGLVWTDRSGGGTVRDSAPDSTTTHATDGTTTSASSPVAAAVPECVPDPSLDQPPAPPPALAAALTQFVTHPRVAPHDVTLSVWIDGLGETLRHAPDLQLAPASNQKLFTAMGALSVLGADARLATELRLTPAGDLAVVGGGDATITASGPHSVAALAEQVRAHGIGVVTGSLIVDETRHDSARRAAAWQDWQIPAYTGPLSAFTVDGNRWRTDPAFVEDPALANAELLRNELSARGITVSGPTVSAAAATSGTVVASLASAPVGELVHEMLQRSDNQIADLLLKEVGYAGAGVGSLQHGSKAATIALGALCVPIEGIVDDGSGLSRGNDRSAREWRTMLQGARDEPWFPVLLDGLPLAGRTGTLAGRFHGSPAEGNVRAKTGTIIGGSALSGYGTTAGGRSFVFSVVVNGPGAEASAGAIDALVTAIAAHPD